MSVKIVEIGVIFMFVLFSNIIGSRSAPPELVKDITDENWNQIQKGQWLVGFFDKETKESLELEEDWPVFALKCKEQDINVGKVTSPFSPGLLVRFLATFFPKVFYIKNGVAHEVLKPNRETLFNFTKDKTWSLLKPVNFLNNPFSIQMSLLSHLFIHAVRLYNYEDSIVQQYIAIPSATDVVFGLTFIVIGTVCGLLITVVFGILGIIFMDKAKEVEEKSSKQDSDSAEEDSDKEDSKSDKDSKKEDASEPTHLRKRM